MASPNVMAAWQVRLRIRRKWLRRALVVAIALFSAFMVVGRLLSGVHWLSDIVGGALFSGGPAELYDGVLSFGADRLFRT